MELSDVVRILKQLERPFTDSLDTFRGIEGSMDLRFRGGSLGQILFSVREEGYIGNRRCIYWVIEGSTFCAGDLNYAFDKALERTDPNTKATRHPGMTGGGRYDPRTGKKMLECDVPCIMAIDTQPYKAVNVIVGPVNPKDVVILFDHRVDRFTEMFSEDQLRSYASYAQLLERCRIAKSFDETILNQYQNQFLDRDLRQK
jgi:hypothetical protein